MTSSNAPVLAVVDDGFRQMKLLTPDTRQVHSSVVRAGFSLGGGIGVDAGAGGYSTEGRDYTVTQDAEGEDTRFDDYALSQINRVLVHHALFAAGLGGRDVVLGTGLPFRMYFEPGSNKANAELLKKKMANLATPVESMDGGKAPSIVRQQVFPQGLMAYVDYALDDELKMRPEIDPTAPVVVVDVGGRTTDTATIVRGSTVDHAASGTVNLGVSNIHDKLDALLRARFNVSKPIATSRLDLWLRQGKVMLRGEQHEIGNEIAQAVGDVLEQVRRELQRRVGDAAEMQAVLLVGGGAPLLADGLRRDYPHVKVPGDPEFANARGMLKTLRMSAAA